MRGDIGNAIDIPPRNYNLFRCSEDLLERRAHVTSNFAALSSIYLWYRTLVSSSAKISARTNFSLLSPITQVFVIQ